MPAEEVSSDAILETMKERERWLRMLQVNTRKLKEAADVERVALETRRKVIKKHLAYYEDLLGEMKTAYSPVTMKEILHG